MTYSHPIQEAASPHADVNGDNYCDLQDLIVITSAENYNQTAPVIPFTET